MQREHPERTADWRHGDIVEVRPHKLNHVGHTTVFTYRVGLLDLSKPPVRGRYLVWWQLLGTLRINQTRITNLSAQWRARSEY
jgi:hypothetical protein